MVDTSDMYPNAPLALVVLEVRFPGMPGGRPLPVTAQRSFREELGDDWVIQPLKTQRIDIELGDHGGGQQSVQQTVVPRFTVRDRTQAVALPEGSMTVETTSYGRYAEFRGLLERVFSAAARILRPEGLARVGFRYVDELRIPDAQAGDPSIWRDWLDPSLLSPCLSAMADMGFAATAWNGIAQYDVGEGKKLVLRHGVGDGYAVPPNAALRRSVFPPSGPFFVLDFDCFWEPVGIPEFDTELLLSTCDELRRPIRALFDLLTSARLRDEVFMKEMPGD